MSKLNLSTDLQLPPEIGTETIAILGRRGSGKSNTATVIAEELIRAGQQVVVIDPKGEAWGLKAQGDGAAGLNVIVFGEPQGDLPLREEHGPIVADFVVGQGRSCVLSVKGLVSDASQRRFVARFAERLCELKGRPGNNAPLMVVIDESHLFAPQRTDPGVIDVLTRLQRMVRLGRSSGIGVTMVDQRPASVNKDLLTQLEVMICHQLTAPQDRKAVDEWIEANADKEQAAEFRHSLPTLAKGEAWVWSPVLLKIFKRVKVRHRDTFDSSATPVLGARGVMLPKMRPVNLDELRGALDAVVAEAKENDPKALKAQVAKLTADLVKAATAKPATAEVRTVEKPVVTEAQVKAVEGIVDRLEREGRERIAAADQLRQSGELLVKQGGEFAAALRMAAARPDAPPVARVPHTYKFSDPNAPPMRSPDGIKAHRPVRAAPVVSAGPGTSMAKAERLALTALAQYPDGRTKVQVALLTGYAHTGGGFNNALSAARGKGWLEGSGDRLAITPAGVAALGDYEPLPTGEALLNHWRGQLGKAEREILDVLVAAFPDRLTKVEVAEQTPSRYTPDGGGFNNALSRLRTLELIQGRGELSASADLFDVVPA